MRLPKGISTQYLGSVVAFLIAGSLFSFALGQQLGHAARVPQAVTAHSHTAMLVDPLAARGSIQIATQVARQPAAPVVALQSQSNQMTAEVNNTGGDGEHHGDHHGGKKHGGDGQGGDGG